MSHIPEPLSAEALRWEFSREEIAPAEGGAPSTSKFIGQERAERALEYGLSMRFPDFNVYIAGPPGTGKSTLCRSACERLACDRPVPADIVFVNNFDDPDRPVWLSFPAGLGKAFHEDMEALITELRDSIPKAFEDEAQEGRRKEVIEEAQARQKALFDNLESLAKEAGFAIRATQAGFALHPLIEGEPATEETFEKLTEGERKQIDEERAAFADHINEFVQETRALEKEIREKMHELDKDIAFTVVNVPVNDLREKYKDYENVLQYLDKVQGHILGNLTNFRGQDEEKAGPLLQLQRPPGEESFRAYEVNVVVNNAGLSCAPIVAETNPNFSNLFGRIERKAHFGTYTTDFTLIRAGSMIAANGGFLILNALDVLINPGVWPALKRALRTRCVRFEDLGEMYGWSTGGLKPTPVPVDVKIILMGSPMIYYLLLRHDEEFSKHFKVKSDFGSLIDRTPESMRDFLGLIEFHREQSDLLPFDDGAVGRILQDSARAVAHKEKMSARFSEMRELLLEADHWAREKGDSAVREEHVIHALEERRFRSNLIDERLRELITEGTMMIDTAGAVVGQVNGLAVLDLGDYSFGKPSRITAQTFMGEKGVVNIERESKLSGNIHDKGMLILQGYLGATYARRRPLALSASLCFEQSYSGVDGDSASSTELYAIMSSLAELPIKQGFAVTGSVNQRGEIQPIGGVNEKIEGFFEVCKEMEALNGEAGVLIPHQNVKNLILRDEVIEAVEAGKFRIYPIRTVDEGIAVLTGVPAGEPDPETGDFPPDTVHGKVEAKLKGMYEDLRRLTQKVEEKIVEAEPEIPPDKPPAPPEPPPPPPRGK